MTTDPIEPPPEYESDDVNKPSRFSDDEVETEIEVETQENDNEAQKKKKRRKKRSQKTKQDATNENGIVEEKNSEKADLRKTLSNPSEDSESLSNESLSKRKSLKQKFYRFRAAPFLFLIGCKICVLLPIAIYACDVIIAMNTPEYNALDLFHHPKNNATSLELPPNPYKTADFPYDKTIMKLLYRVENENRIARMQHEHNIRYRTAVLVTAANATGNETVPTLQRDIMTT
uniref:Uncharacterized protein n=3 Tax=Ciona intestinalis TaxID=7719 RepID=F6YFQ7_CIOIN